MKTKIMFRTMLAVISILFISNTASYSQSSKPAEIKIKTSAVCGQCKDRIEKGMVYEKGIKDINLDVATKVATVKYNPLKTNPSDIRRAISKLGYDADSIPADKIAYNKLPSCCKKDAKKH